MLSLLDLLSVLIGTAFCRRPVLSIWRSAPGAWEPAAPATVSDPLLSTGSCGALLDLCKAEAELTTLSCKFLAWISARTFVFLLGADSGMNGCAASEAPAAAFLFYTHCSSCEVFCFREKPGGASALLTKSGQELLLSKPAKSDMLALLNIFSRSSMAFYAASVTHFQFGLLSGQVCPYAAS